MNNSRNKILVAIDFEEQSLCALEHSYELARLFDADLVLLYVIEGISTLGKLRSPEEYVKNIIEEAREKFDGLEELARRVSGKESVNVTALIEKGKPYEKILETATDQNAIMIVIGKSSYLEQKKKRRFVGSNSYNVIRDAPCPVIAIKESGTLPGEYKKILLPLDFTRQTKKQVQKAIEFGGYFGARIHVISILRTDNKVTKLLKQVQLNQVKNAIQKNGIECKSEFIFNKQKSIAEIIIEYSKSAGIDLIIIMTQQKKSAINYYVGSTAHEVINESDIPVLSIIPTADFKPGMVTSMVDPLGVIKHKETNAGTSASS